MTDKGEFTRAKYAIKGRLRELLEGKVEAGLTDLKRDLFNSSLDRDLVENGLFVAKMLNAIGWQRDGFMHTGYDRTPRYTPKVANG